MFFLSTRCIALEPSIQAYKVYYALLSTTAILDPRCCGMGDIEEKHEVVCAFREFILMGKIGPSHIQCTLARSVRQLIKNKWSNSVECKL